MDHMGSVCIIEFTAFALCVVVSSVKLVNHVLCVRSFAYLMKYNIVRVPMQFIDV